MLPSLSVGEIKELLKAGMTLEAQESILALKQAALDLQGEGS